MEGLLGEVLKLWHVAYDKGRSQLQKVLGEEEIHTD